MSPIESREKWAGIFIYLNRITHLLMVTEIRGYFGFFTKISYVGFRMKKLKIIFFDHDYELDLDIAQTS